MSPQIQRQRAPYYAETAQWKIVCGHVLASLWILVGVLYALAGALVSRVGAEVAAGTGAAGAELGDSAGTVGGIVSGMGFCAGIIGVFQILLGLGMILRWAWVPVWVYILCGLSILGSAVSLMRGKYEYSWEMGLDVFSLLLAIFMVYIMYETREEY